MKFAIERKLLLPAVTTVLGAVDKKVSLPILSCVHVQGTGRQLILTASNLELTLRTTLDFAISEPFEAVFPAYRWRDILRAFPEDGMVGIAVETDKLAIHCGRSRFSLAHLDPHDYPLIDDRNEPEFSFVLDQEALMMALKRTSFAMAHDDVRYYLNGLCFHGRDTELRVIATDGHRLAKATVSETLSFDTEWEVILPDFAISELRRICGTGLIEVDVCRNLLKFQAGHTTLFSKKVDGRFPSYEAVIPKDTDRSIVVEREALLNALNRVRLVMDKTDSTARLSILEDCLQIDNTGESNDHAEEEVDMESTMGTTLELGLNTEYLSEVLSVLESDRVRIQVQDPMSGIKIVEEDRVYVIMPCRL